jgi:hypothetical protein
MAKKLSKPETAPIPATSQTDAKSARTDRVGKRLIAAHFDEDIARQLKVLAALEGRTVLSLLTEALTMLFAKHAQTLGRVSVPDPTSGRRRRTAPKTGVE